MCMDVRSVRDLKIRGSAHTHTHDADGGVIVSWEDAERGRDKMLMLSC